MGRGKQPTVSPHNQPSRETQVKHFTRRDICLYLVDFYTLLHSALRNKAEQRLWQWIMAEQLATGCALILGGSRTFVLTEQVKNFSASCKIVCWITLKDGIYILLLCQLSVAEGSWVKAFLGSFFIAADVRSTNFKSLMICYDIFIDIETWIIIIMTWNESSASQTFSHTVWIEECAT